MTFEDKSNKKGMLLYNTSIDRLKKKTQHQIINVFAGQSNFLVYKLNVIRG